jgi:hypothetical protein
MKNFDQSTKDATAATINTCKEGFLSPPGNARPGVYWYFMDGNQNREEMIADLHAMVAAGVGTVLFLEVDVAVARGPVPFMSEEWQDNVVHAFKTASELGMEVILGTGPGWAGSGGGWVQPEDSMQHLVGSSIEAEGPGHFEATLPLPPPHTPNRFAGMNPALQEIRDKWYQDVAVIAFPAPEGEPAIIVEKDLKTLKDVMPYSINKKALPFVRVEESAAPLPPESILDGSKVIDLTDKLLPDGTLCWDVPPGHWTIMRFVARSTGQTTRPAPRTGHGFECDKFNAGAFERHWQQYQQKLLEKLGPLTPGKGLTTMHLDSWEMSSQNWSGDFRAAFRVRRGYDPLPWFPAWLGMIVESVEKTERFLWDMRKTAQELVLENHAGAIKRIANEHGLLYSNEPYDMNPAGNLDLGSIADIPVCEFWNATEGPDTQYSCIEVVSIAHTMGRSIVGAESFTTRGLQFMATPGNLKNQTDWAFAMGINWIFFHTYQHQPLGSDALPGMTMGPYGIQWHRNNTMWKHSSGYHGYIARCSYLLRQGVAVADILYLTPEGAPHIFVAPEDALDGVPRLRDKKGYNFDAVSPRILAMRATVEDGCIAFPGGSRYRLLVLPNVAELLPETLHVIARLVEAGAAIIGQPPRKSPSLVGYPDCDRQVQDLSSKLWKAPQEPVCHVGKGRVYRAKSLPDAASLYPSYAELSQVLAEMDIPEDFHATGPVRYGHRRTNDGDLYFVANNSEQTIDVDCSFRSHGTAELWDPVEGSISALPSGRQTSGVMTLPLRFAAYQSFFVVFKRQCADSDTPSVAAPFPQYQSVLELDGAWTVAFDPARGGPGEVAFEQLQDWTSHSLSGIKYYSGSAFYRKSFELTAKPDGRMLLDLGNEVHDICRVRLNGQDLGILWTAPWRMHITDALRAGDNELEIEVVNRWVNRLVGDQQPEDKDQRTLVWESGLLAGKPHNTGRYTFCTNSPYVADSPLLPSGLIGPVQILKA